MVFAGGAATTDDTESIGIDLIRRAQVEVIETRCSDLFVGQATLRRMCIAPHLEALCSEIDRCLGVVDASVSVIAIDAPTRYEVIPMAMTHDGLMIGGGVREYFDCEKSQRLKRRPISASSELALLRAGVVLQEAGVYLCGGWTDVDAAAVIGDVSRVNLIGFGPPASSSSWGVALTPPEVLAGLDALDVPLCDTWALACRALATGHQRESLFDAAKEESQLIDQWTAACGPIPDEIRFGPGIVDLPNSPRRRDAAFNPLDRLRHAAPRAAAAFAGMLTMAPSSRMTASDACLMTTRHGEDPALDGNLLRTELSPIASVEVDFTAADGTKPPPPRLNSSWTSTRAAIAAQEVRTSIPAPRWTAALFDLLRGHMSSLLSLMHPREVVAVLDVVRRLYPDGDAAGIDATQVALEVAAAAVMVVVCDRDLGDDSDPRASEECTERRRSLARRVAQAVLGEDCPTWTVKATQLRILRHPSAWRTRFLSRTASNYIVASALPSRGAGDPLDVINAGHRALVDLAKRTEDNPWLHLDDEQLYLLATAKRFTSSRTPVKRRQAAAPDDDGGVAAVRLSRLVPYL